MYGRGGGSLIASGVVTGGSAVVLPFTGGNHLGEILAYTALSIGSITLCSQIVVRVLRRIYS